MTKSEMTHITGAIEGAVFKAVQPIHDELAKHRQTLYGPGGDNGLCGEMKQMRVVAEDYKIYKGKLATIGAIGAVIFGAVGGLVSKIIKIGSP
jgi:hypothetical protein